MTAGIRDQKNELRRSCGAYRPSAAVRRRRSLKISAAVTRSALWKKASAVGFFSGLADEPDLSAAAAAAIDSGKRIYFPRLSGGRISFCEVRDLRRDLKKGAYGIYEPAAKRRRVKPLDLILVPGRVFDRRGGRIGRGAGHYDRLLEKWSGVKCIGIAFREQLTRKVPREKHDIKMNAVIAA